MTFLLFIALLIPEDGKVLILRGGKKIPLQHGFEVSGPYVHFTSAHGQLLQLPVKSVDLVATRSTELARRESIGKPIVVVMQEVDRDLTALTDEIFSAGEMSGERMRSDLEAPSAETNVVLDELEDSEMLTEGAVSRITRDARYAAYIEASKRRAQKQYNAAQRTVKQYNAAQCKANNAESDYEKSYGSQAEKVADKRKYDAEVKRERRGKMFDGGIDAKSRSETTQRIKDLNKTRKAVRNTKVKD